MGDGSAGVPESLLAAVARHASEIMVLVDDTGTIVWGNERNGELWDDPQDIVGRNPLDLVHPDHAERAILALASLDSPFPRPPGRYALLTGDGTYRMLDSGGTRLEHDGRTYYLFSFRPNPFLETQTAALSLLASEETVTAALDALANGLTGMEAGFTAGVALDDGDRRVVVGPIADELLGVSGGIQDVTPDTPWGAAIERGETVSITEPDGLPPRIRSLAERHGFEGVCVYPLDDPEAKQPALFVVWFAVGAGVASNQLISYTISLWPKQLVQLALDRRSERRRLVHLALHDPLTGLANRAHFRDELERAVGPRSADAPVAVVYVDLDDFKPINDRHGHDAGDRVLRVIASRFRAAVRPGDLVARIGGDEFAVLCVGIDDIASARAIADRLVEAAAEPIDGEPSLEVGASAGVAFVGDPRNAPSDRLLQAADESLYEVKRERKGSAAVIIVD